MSSGPDGYDAAKDGHDSYFAAIEAKRLRGDRHGWAGPPPAWQLVSPAPKSAILALASAHARVRRLFLAQARFAESVAVFRGDEAVAIMMFGRHGWRRTEVAIAVGPSAALHMGRLLRMAQLTLLPLAETRLIVARVNPANRAGRRLAAMTGFRPARLKRRDLWILRSDTHGRSSGRQ